MSYQNSLKKHLKPKMATTEIKPLSGGHNQPLDLAPKQLKFQNVSSSESSSSEEDNCEDVGEDSLPIASSHHAVWAEHYFQ
jgi:hypothetical protein